MKLRIFFSWQTASDTKRLHNKSFILSCIHKASDEISNKGLLKGVSFEVQEGTSGVPGTPEMIPTCEKRIDECHIFIADFTVERKFSWFYRKLLTCTGKQLRVNQNTNVANEWGRASGRLSPDQLIAVMNTVNGCPEDRDSLSVDFSHRRWPITFFLEQDKREGKSDEAYVKAEKDLVETLKKAIQSSALAAIEHMDEELRPFVKWRRQRNGVCFDGRFFWNDHLRGIQQSVLDNKGILRLIGLSGLGKTRLVNEAFQESEWLRMHYLYVDCYTTTNLIDKLERLLTSYPEVYLVFDNCDVELHKQIINRRREAQGSNPVITIYNDPLEERDRQSEYLVLQKKSDEVVEGILSELSELDRQLDLIQLKEFSGGIPMIARLLVKGIRDGVYGGIIDYGDLMSKVLGVGKDSEERSILRALSLFSFIGYKGNRRREMEFIAMHRGISSIPGDDERRVTKFDEVIQEYLGRAVIETKGRLVGIRPTPIALYLLGEWIERCGEERLYQVLESIQSSEMASSLTEAFCMQFRYMGTSSSARQILSGIAAPNSPFAGVKVINSRFWSRLLRSFVEVNPEVVAQVLEEAMKTRELPLDDARSNIIWTVEKLCFEPSTFDRGVRIMLHLAMAENDASGLQATESFTNLFPINRPATAAPLSYRLSYLRAQIEYPDCYPLLIKAIGKALKTRDFVYFGGPEIRGLERLENYLPNTWSEINDYEKGCLDILMQIITEDQSLVSECREVLESALWQRCDQEERIVLIWPYVQRLAELLEYDCDELHDALCKIVHNPHSHFSEGFKGEINHLIDRLTKDDFYSRYARTPKLSVRGWRTQSEALEHIARDYAILAKEMAEHKLYSVEMLGKIYALKSIGYYQFGSALAQCLSEPDQKVFISRSIEALNRLEKPDILQFIDFLRVIPEATFAWAFEEMKQHLNDKQALFASVAMRGYGLNNEYVDELLSLVEDGIVGGELFVTYSYFLPYKDRSVGGMLALLKRVSHLHNAFSVVLRLYEGPLRVDVQEKNDLTTFLQEELRCNLPHLKEYVHEESLWCLLKKLLEMGVDASFASLLMDSLIVLMERPVAGRYETEIFSCFSLLLLRYFNDVWPAFSRALLRRDEAYYRIQIQRHELFRSTKVYEHIFHDSKNKALVMQWCDEYRHIAPSRLMRMIPLYKDDRFSDLVHELLNHYGDQDDVLDALSCNMESFSWVGSIIPRYEKMLKCISSISEHPIERVRVWAERRRQLIQKQMCEEQDRDEERDLY